MKMIKPKLKLVGADGNAFAILGLAKRAANKYNMPKEEWEKIRNEAMQGDYVHLLQTIMEHFDVSELCT